jgi:hypothetical protein
LILRRIDELVLDRLPGVNKLVMSGQYDIEDLIAEMNASMSVLPCSDSVPEVAAEQLLVQLGICGSLVVHHYQEKYAGTVTTQPSLGLIRLFGGASATPFRQYIHEIIGRSGTGHPERAAYASLVRWNVGTTKAYWRGECVAESCSMTGSAYLVRSRVVDFG